MHQRSIVGNFFYHITGRICDYSIFHAFPRELHKMLSWNHGISLHVNSLYVDRRSVLRNIYVRLLKVGVYFYFLLVVIVNWWWIQCYSKAFVNVWKLSKLKIFALSISFSFIINIGSIIDTLITLVGILLYYHIIYEGLQAKVTSLKLRLEMICSNCHA